MSQKEMLKVIPVHACVVFGVVLAENVSSSSMVVLWTVFVVFDLNSSTACVSLADSFPCS